MIVPGILVCSSFLISVCMFIVSKALLISSVIVIVRAWGAIWLCFVSVLRLCVGYVCCYVRKQTLLQCLCCVWDGDYGSQLPYVWYYMLLLGF